MSRVKAAAMLAPSSIEQAANLLVQLARIVATIAAHDARRGPGKQEIDAAADACIVPLAAERDDLFKRLQPWYEANVEILTAGKRKSIERSGCTIGGRTTPPKLVFEQGKDADGVAAAALRPRRGYVEGAGPDAHQDIDLCRAGDGPGGCRRDPA